MKKYVFALIACLLVNISFVSCSDDEESSALNGSSVSINGEKVSFIEASVQLFKFKKGYDENGDIVNNLPGESFFRILGLEGEPLCSFDFKSEWIDTQEVQAGYVLKKAETTYFVNLLNQYSTDFSYKEVSGNIEIIDITEKHLTLKFNNYTFRRIVTGNVALSDKDYIVNGSVKFEIDTNS